jgi:hypothetical protein
LRGEEMLKFFDSLDERGTDEGAPVGVVGRVYFLGIQLPDVCGIWLCNGLGYTRDPLCASTHPEFIHTIRRKLVISVPRRREVFIHLYIDPVTLQLCLQT